MVELFCPLAFSNSIATVALGFFLLLYSVFFFLSFSTAEGFFSRSDNATVTGWETFLQALNYFLKMFFGSAALGTLTGLISALVSRLLHALLRSLCVIVTSGAFHNSLISF